MLITVQENQLKLVNGLSLLPPSELNLSGINACYLSREQRLDPAQLGECFIQIVSS
jgi:hypothetical protein